MVQYPDRVEDALPSARLVRRRFSIGFPPVSSWVIQGKYQERESSMSFLSDNHSSLESYGTLVASFVYIPIYLGQFCTKLRHRHQLIATSSSRSLSSCIAVNSDRQRAIETIVLDIPDFSADHLYHAPDSDLDLEKHVCERTHRQ